MRIQYLFFKKIIILTALILSGCTNDEHPEEGPSGKIVGKITLYDKFEKEVKDKHGIAVEVIQKDKKYSVTTNTDGNFILPEIPLGEVIINFKKDKYRGYDSLRFKHNLQIDSLNVIKLVEVPPSSIKIERVQILNSIFPWMVTSYNSGTTFSVSTWFFFSKSPHVSSTNFKVSKSNCCFSGHENYSRSYAYGFPPNFFYEKGFSPGDIIYIVAYPGNSIELNFHMPEAGYNYYRFPTFDENNPSNIVSFILP